jgi:hypothetical protein
MLCGSFVQPVVGLHDAIAAGIVIRSQSGRSSKQQEAAQRGSSQRCLSKPGQIPLGCHMV